MELNMMGHKERLKTANEYGAIFAKKYLCVFFNNTGLAKFVKKCINKRNRKQAKKEVNNENL